MSTPVREGKQYPIIKGSHILSNACAWADDEHITPRQAAPSGTQLATEEKRPVLGWVGRSFSYHPASHHFAGEAD